MKKSKGFALLLVIIISAFLLSLTAILGTSMISEAKMASNQQKKTQAYYIARAGAAATAKWITSLKDSDLDNFNSETFPVHSIAQNFGGGTFQVKLTQTSDKKQLLIESTGSIANGKKSDGTTLYTTDTATVVLNRSAASNTTQVSTVIYANENINATSTINGDIGTNSSSSGAINFQWGSQGSSISNIYIPVGGNPNSIIHYPNYFSFGNNPQIVTNSIRTYQSPILPDFPYKNGSFTKQDISLSGAQSMTINQSGYYNNISISANTNLTVDTTNGDINIRAANLNIPQGNIKIKGNGNLNLYVDNFTIGTIKGSINLGGNKDHFKLYYNGTVPFTIDGATNINGSVFFGAAELTITAGGIVSGDIFSAGNNINISGGASVGPEVIYAPNAFVNITNGTIKSAIIGNSVTVTGGAQVNMPSNPVKIQIPGETGPSTSAGYSIGYWK